MVHGIMSGMIGSGVVGLFVFFSGKPGMVVKCMMTCAIASVVAVIAANLIGFESLGVIGVAAALGCGSLHIYEGKPDNAG